VPLLDFRRVAAFARKNFGSASLRRNLFNTGLRPIEGGGLCPLVSSHIISYLLAKFFTPPNAYLPIPPISPILFISA
jgi:hypothetical protein